MVENDSLSSTFTRNVLVSMGTKALYLITRVFIPPFILTYLSLEEYGLWTYCFILLGYMGMTVNGISVVYIRYAALYNAHNEAYMINHLISTGLICVTTLCLILIPCFYFLLPILFSLFNIPPYLYQTAFYVIFGTLLIFALDLSLGVFNCLLQGLQKIVAERIVWTFSYLIDTFFIIVFLSYGWGIYGLLAAFSIRILASILMNIWLCYHYLPALAISWKYFDKKILKLFYTYGGIIQLTGLLGLTNQAMEKLLAGSFIGPKATALYDIGEKLPVMSIQVPGAINTVLLPTNSHLFAQNENSKIQKLYLQSGRFIHLMIGAMTGFMGPFAFAILTAWLGPDPKYAPAIYIMMIFSLAYQLNEITGPASAIFRSHNLPQKELYYGIGQLSLVIMCVTLGFHYFGVSIPVINACVASMMMVASSTYLYYANRFLGLSHWSYFKTVIFPGLLPWILGFALAFGSETWQPALEAGRIPWLSYLVLMSSMYGAVLLPWIYFTLTVDEKKFIRKLIPLKQRA